MGKLSVFLKPSPVGKTKKLVIDRFTDEEGNIAPIIIKSISPQENEEISNSCMDANGNLDSSAYGNKLIVACMQEPNLKDSEICKFYGVIDPAMVPGIMFTIGEKQLIQDAIMDINDIKDAKKKLNEAKNS